MNLRDRSHETHDVKEVIIELRERPCKTRFVDSILPALFKLGIKINW